LSNIKIDKDLLNIVDLAIIKRNRKEAEFEPLYLEIEEPSYVPEPEEEREYKIVIEL
jgi:hypothetical protein